MCPTVDSSPSDSPAAGADPTAVQAELEEQRAFRLQQLGQLAEDGIGAITSGDEPRLQVIRVLELGRPGSARRYQRRPRSSRRRLLRLLRAVSTADPGLATRGAADETIVHRLPVEGRSKSPLRRPPTAGPADNNPVIKAVSGRASGATTTVVTASR
jgi:hypothetical protein